jgi:hypothetical protein
MAGLAEEDRGNLVANMIAEYFDIDPTDIQGYLIGVERATEDGGLVFSSIWSMNKPMWQLLGFCDELKAHIEKQRDGDLVPPSNGEVPESRQVRRARARTRGRGTRPS